MWNTRRSESPPQEARLGRGGYVVGAMWDEGNMVHAIRRFGGTTMDGVEVRGRVQTGRPPIGGGISSYNNNNTHTYYQHL